MSVPANIELYKAVKADADKKFLSKTGIYKSSWIVREYKKRGGTYLKKRKPTGGLLRWYKEQWVNLNRPIYNKKGQIIGYEQCGREEASNKGLYPLCRPLKRVTKETPTTVKELTRKAISQANISKQRVRHTGNIKFEV
jgi:hypothetical protein